MRYATAVLGLVGGAMWIGPGSVGWASASTMQVGQGDRSASLVFNWYDEAGLEKTLSYQVHFTGPTIDGFELTAIADEADTQLGLSWSAFDFGAGPQHALTTASYIQGPVTYFGDGHTYSSPDHTDNFWAQWVDDDASGAYTFGPGAEAFTVTDGAREAWVFGNSTAQPVPEPASLALLALGAALSVGRRRLA